MNEITLKQFQTLLPLATAWVAEQEKIIIQHGVELSKTQLDDAFLVGVSHPKLVRLLSVEKIPMPTHPQLRAAAELTGLISPYANGVTMQYGIFIRTRSWGERSLIIHELVHTKQYEQLGGIEPFLEQYLMECLTLGYPDCPMEQEAINTANKICGRPAWEG